MYSDGPTDFQLDTEDTLDTLYDKLSRKASADLQGQPVQPGWLKYSWNGSIWNLDDGQWSTPQNAKVLSRPYFPVESDYTIFVWRQKSVIDGEDSMPVLHLRNPEQPLPVPPAYQNPSFYQFRSGTAARNPSQSRNSNGDRQSLKSGKSKKTTKQEPQDTVPQHKKEFEKFHSENGVRTVYGNIGPVSNGTLVILWCSSLLTRRATVRMLLKNGYRHVYISRKFALRHGFIPNDAAPGHYGYGGLVKYALRN